MSISSTEVNAMVYKYLIEAGFMHSAYNFSHESQITRAFPEMAALPPGALIRFVQKGVQYAELEANLKEDRTAVEEDYQLVSAADAVLNDSRDLRDVVLAQRADKEESSEDQENLRDSAERGTATQQSRSQARAQLAEQRPARGMKRSRGRSASMHPQPPSPVRQSPLEAAQPQHAQPQSDHQMSEQPLFATSTSSQSPEHAPAARDMPNGHVQAAARPAHSLVPISPPQITVLDAQNRETRMCSWCPTAAVLASGLGDPEALLWSVDNGSRDTQMPTVLAHSGAESDKSSVVECMDWQSAGSMLATGSMDGWVRVWSKSGQLLQTLKGHQSAVTCVKFSRHTNLLLSGSVDKTAMVWQADTGVQLQRVTGHSGSVCCVAWKDDQQFATASAGHHIQFTSGEPGGRETWRGDAPDITHLTWSPDGELLVSCCEGGTILVWSVYPNTCLHTLKDHTADIDAVSWSPVASHSKQHMLATASHDHTVRLWDLLHGSCQHKLSLVSKVQSVDFHVSGKILITGCDDGEVCMWSIPDGRRIYSCTCSGSVTSVAWNDKGNTVAAACRNQTVHLVAIDFR